MAGRAPPREAANPAVKRSTFDHLRQLKAGAKTAPAEASSKTLEAACLQVNPDTSRAAAQDVVPTGERRQAGAAIDRGLDGALAGVFNAAPSGLVAQTVQPSGGGPSHVMEIGRQIDDYVRSVPHAEHLLDCWFTYMVHSNKFMESSGARMLMARLQQNIKFGPPSAGELPQAHIDSEDVAPVGTTQVAGHDQAADGEARPPKYYLSPSHNCWSNFQWCDSSCKLCCRDKDHPSLQCQQAGEGAFKIPRKLFQRKFGSSLPSKTQQENAGASKRHGFNAAVVTAWCGAPLQVCLRDMSGRNVPAPYDMDIEVVVLSPQSSTLLGAAQKEVKAEKERFHMGGFIQVRQEGDEPLYWSEQDFDKYVESEVAGTTDSDARPSIVHNRTVLLKGQRVATFQPDMAICKVTPKNGHLRLGIRCISTSGPEDPSIRRPLEAISEPIEVNSARSKNNEKARIPLYSDPVKRLEKVGAKLEERLREKGIETVQDLLYVVHFAKKYSPNAGRSVTKSSQGSGKRSLRHGKTKAVNVLSPDEAHHIVEALQKNSALSIDDWNEMVRHAEKAIESEGVPRCFYDAASGNPPEYGIMFTNSMIPVALLDHSERDRASAAPCSSMGKNSSRSSGQARSSFKELAKLNEADIRRFKTLLKKAYRYWQKRGHPGWFPLHENTLDSGNLQLRDAQLSFEKRREYVRNQEKEFAKQGLLLTQARVLEPEDDVFPTQESIDLSHPMTQEEPPPYVPQEKDKIVDDGAAMPTLSQVTLHLPESLELAEGSQPYDTNNLSDTGQPKEEGTSYPVVALDGTEDGNDAVENSDTNETRTLGGSMPASQDLLDVFLQSQQGVEFGSQPLLDMFQGSDVFNVNPMVSTQDLEHLDKDLPSQTLLPDQDLACHSDLDTSDRQAKKRSRTSWSEESDEEFASRVFDEVATPTAAFAYRSECDIAVVLLVLSSGSA